MSTSLKLSHLGAVAAMAIALGSSCPALADKAPTSTQVIENYANIAHAGYADSTAGAKKLLTAVDALIAKPNACWQNSTGSV